MNIDRPKVGIGVIIINENSEILIGKRKGSHAPYFSIPGGHLELGETFEETAIREIKEETGISIRNPKVIGVTNDLITYKNENKHFVSIVLITNEFSGKAELKEPDKCESWQWVDPQKLPLPHFKASEMAVECYLKKEFYFPK